LENTSGSYNVKTFFAVNCIAVVILSDDFHQMGLGPLHSTGLLLIVIIIASLETYRKGRRLSDAGPSELPDVLGERFEYGYVAFQNLHPSFFRNSELRSILEIVASLKPKEV
jgi:hypothetical protein